MYIFLNRWFPWNNIIRRLILLLFLWVFRCSLRLFLLLFGGLGFLEIRFLRLLNLFIWIFLKIWKLLIWISRYFTIRSLTLQRITIRESTFFSFAFEMLHQEIICICNYYLHIFLLKSIFWGKWIIQWETVDIKFTYIVMQPNWLHVW